MANASLCCDYVWFFEDLCYIFFPSVKLVLIFCMTMYLEGTLFALVVDFMPIYWICVIEYPGKWYFKVYDQLYFKV